MYLKITESKPIRCRKIKSIRLRADALINNLVKFCTFLLARYCHMGSDTATCCQGNMTVIRLLQFFNMLISASCAMAKAASPSVRDLFAGSFSRCFSPSNSDRCGSRLKNP